MVKGYLVGDFNPFVLLPAEPDKDWPGQVDFAISPVVGKLLKNLAYWELDAWDIDPKLVEKLQQKVNVKVNIVERPKDLDYVGFSCFVLREDVRTGTVHVWEVNVNDAY